MERLLKYFLPERYQLDIKIDKYANTIGVCREFGKHEYELERYFDHYLACVCLIRRIDKTKLPAQEGL